MKISRINHTAFLNKKQKSLNYNRLGFGNRHFSGAIAGFLCFFKYSSNEAVTKIILNILRLRYKLKKTKAKSYELCLPLFRQGYIYIEARS